MSSVASNFCAIFLLLMILPVGFVTWYFLSEADTNQFFFSGGSYYVSKRDPIVGCITAVGVAASSSTLMKGDQCVKIYDQEDCRGTALEAPSSIDNPSLVYERIASFHQCDWSPPKISLYERAYQSGFLNTYRDLKECTNLPYSEDNKVSSVNTHGNCFNLYDLDNCEGEMVQVTRTSPYHYALSQLNFDNKASSIIGCGRDDDK